MSRPDDASEMNIVDGHEFIGLNPTLDLKLSGDGVWPDLNTRPVHYTNRFALSALPHGMQGGRVSLALRIDLADGTTVFCETSMRLFTTAADALRARYDEQQRFVDLNRGD